MSWKRGQITDWIDQGAEFDFLSITADEQKLLVTANKPLWVLHYAYDRVRVARMEAGEIRTIPVGMLVELRLFDELKELKVVRQHAEVLRWRLAEDEMEKEIVDKSYLLYGGKSPQAKDQETRLKENRGGQVVIEGAVLKGPIFAQTRQYLAHHPMSGLVVEDFRYVALQEKGGA